jgi:hypothetical protein
MTIITAKTARENVTTYEATQKAKAIEETEGVLKRVSDRIAELSNRGLEEIIVPIRELVECSLSYFIETLEQAGYTVSRVHAGGDFRIEW